MKHIQTPTHRQASTGSSARGPSPRRSRISSKAANVPRIVLFAAAALLSAASPRAGAEATPGFAFTNFVGLPGGWGNADGPIWRARFRQPTGVVVAGAGNVIVADSHNHRRRKVSPTGEVPTLALTQSGNGGFVWFVWPDSVARDAAGNLYVSLGFGQIAVVSPQGTLSNLAGANSSGSADGVGTAARFNAPKGLAADSFGNLYVGDAGNATLRWVTPAGGVTTLGGSPQVTGGCDGVGTNALFAFPKAIAVSTNGTSYIADSNNPRIAKGTPLLPPLIVSQPAGKSVACGSSVTLSVAASGAPPLSFQWYRGTNLVPGATSSNYTLDVPSNGLYQVVLRASSGNSGGTAHFDFGAGKTTLPIAIPFTGGADSFQSFTSSGVQLAAGYQVARLALDHAGVPDGPDHRPRRRPGRPCLGEHCEHEWGGYHRRCHRDDLRAHDWIWSIAARAMVPLLWSPHVRNSQSLRTAVR